MMKNRFITLLMLLSVLGVFTYSPRLFSEEPIDSLQKALLDFAENEIADLSRERFYQDPSAQGYLKGYFNRIWRSESLRTAYAKAQKRADEIYKEFETFLQSASSSNIALLYDTLRSEAERVSVTADDAAGKLLLDLKKRCFKWVERCHIERKKKDIENLKDIDTELLIKVRDIYSLLNAVIGQRITYEIEFQRLRKAQSNAISWGATQIDGQDQFFKSLQETYNKDLKRLREERGALSALPPKDHELIAQTIQDIDRALGSLRPITTGVFEGLRKSHWNQILAYKNLILARAMEIQVELGISPVPKNITRMNIELLRSSAEKLSRESHEEMQAAGIAFNQSALFQATDIDVPFLGPEVLDATLILEDVGGGLSLFAVDIGGDIMTGHPLRAGQKVVAAPLSAVAAMKGVTDEAAQSHLKQAVLFRLAQLSDSTGGWAGVSNTDVAIETENEIEFLKAIDAYYISDEHYNPFRTTLGVLLTVATVRVILRPVAFVRNGTARFYLERIKMQRAQDGMIKGSRRTYTPEEIREMSPQKLLEELGLEHKTGRLSAIDYHAMAETIRAILLDSLKDQGGPSIFMGGDGAALFDRETPYRPKPGRRIEDSPESTVPKSTPVRVRQTEGALVKVGAQEQGAILLPEAEPIPTPNVPKRSRIAPPEEVTPEKPHTMSPDAAPSEMPHANAPRISPYPWAGHPLTHDGKETVIIIKRDEKGNIIGARTVRVKKGATEDEIWAELGYRDRRDEIIGLRTNPASDRHALYGMQGNDGASRSGGTGSSDDDLISTLRNKIREIVANTHLDETRKLTMVTTFLEALSQRLAELEASSVSGAPGTKTVSERIRSLYYEIEAEKNAFEVQRDLRGLQLSVVVPPAPAPTLEAEPFLAPDGAPESSPALEQVVPDDVDVTSALTYRGDNPDDRHQHLCNIGEAIREAREFLGMPQRELAIEARKESHGSGNDQAFISAIERPVKGRLSEEKQQKIVAVLIRLIEEKRGIRVFSENFANAETIRHALGLDETQEASPEPSPSPSPTPAPEPAPSIAPEADDPTKDTSDPKYIENFAKKISERHTDLLRNLPDDGDGILKRLLYIWKLELEFHTNLSGQNESYWPYLKALLDIPSVVIIFSILLQEYERPSFLMTEETLRNALSNPKINKEVILEDYMNILNKKGVLDLDILELIREFYPEAPTVRQRSAAEFYPPMDHWSISGVYTDSPDREEKGVTIPRQSTPAPEPTLEPESEITDPTETTQFSAVPETSGDTDTQEMALPLLSEPGDDEIKKALMDYLTDLECKLQLNEPIDKTWFNIITLAEYIGKEIESVRNELTSLKEKQYVPHLLGAIRFLLGEPGGESANPALESGGSTTEIPTGPIREARVFEELLERISPEKLSRIELRIPDRRKGSRNGGEISVRFTAHVLTLLKNPGPKIYHAIIINLFKGYFGIMQNWGVMNIARVDPMYDSIKATSPDGTPVKVRYAGNSHYRLYGSFHDGNSASILFTHLSE